MIIGKISDGFGNQLFMYACAYSLARRCNQNLYLDTTMLDNSKLRKLDLKNINLEYKSLISFKFLKFKPFIVAARKTTYELMRIICKEFKEKKGWKYDDEIEKLSSNVYLNGYWQSYKYFDDYRSKLIEMITPKYKQNANFQELSDKMSSCNSVAVHIRRGDYIKLGCNIDLFYYEKAIKLLENEKKNPIFFVFSDDIDFAKTEFSGYTKNEIIYVDFESENRTLDDFFLMSKCRHQIIANSSFSWWAAYINNYKKRMVIAPQTGVWNNDFYPEDWIKINLD